MARQVKRERTVAESVGMEVAFRAAGTMVVSIKEWQDAADRIQELEARMKALEQTLRDVKKVLGMSSLCEDDIVQAAIEMIKSALEHKAERLEKEEPKP